VGQDVFLYSISIDPARDTPEVLKKYAERYQTGPGWVFLTGAEADITLLRKKLGLYIDEIQEEGTYDHNLSLIIGNQSTGQWMKRSPFENSYVLASEIGGWLHNWKAPREDRNDYEQAPELRNISTGESLFRTRCTACHIIGPGDGITRVGPNLMGVTRYRDRDWLVRWLSAPDQVLAEKDPIAMSLFEAFNGVAMPNLRLNEHEVNSLIEYLETESQRVGIALENDLDFSNPNASAACCEKQENFVLSDDEDTDPVAENAEAVKKRPLLPTASILSIGLGCILGLISVVLRRQSPKPENG